MTFCGSHEAVGILAIHQCHCGLVNLVVVGLERFVPQLGKSLSCVDTFEALNSVTKMLPVILNAGRK